MTIDVRANGYSLRPILTGAPSISDNADAVCRTLTLPIRETADVGQLLGNPVELWYAGKRWYHGYIQRRGIDSAGNTTLTAFDGLFLFKKTTDDFYFKNMTATQGIKTLAAKAKVPIASLANTGAVFKQLWYPGSPCDKVATDLLARTVLANGKKFWLRYDPEAPGIQLQERKEPKEAWAFLAGVNLVDASYEESVEEVYNIVKLVNRETGKVVIKQNAESVTAYLPRQHFEEVDKDAVKTMDKKAEQLLAELSKVAVTMNINGINPDQTMGQFFSGDVIYVEEKTTKIVGAYFITNVTQEFVNDNLVTIAADIQYTPDIPALQYEDAAEKPDFMKTKAEKSTSKAKKDKKAKTKKVGKSKVSSKAKSENAARDAEIKAIIDKNK